MCITHKIAFKKNTILKPSSWKTDSHADKERLQKDSFLCKIFQEPGSPKRFQQDCFLQWTIFYICRALSATLFLPTLLKKT